MSKTALDDVSQKSDKCANECGANGGIMRQPTISSAKPWAAIGMSRASWYRHGKPEHKPERETCASIAELTGWSVRTIQRDSAAHQRQRMAKVREYLDQGFSLEDALAREQRECSAEVARIRLQSASLHQSRTERKRLTPP
jgi:hypothetical protein